jgi:hypothetical protein
MQDQNRMRACSWIGLLSFLVVSTTALGQTKGRGPNDSLSAASLSAKELREIIAGAKKSAYDMPESWTHELRLRRVDLGNGPGIVVQGTRLLCGATGNCQIWIFRKAHANWVSLFPSDQAILAEGFSFGPVVARHVRDLTIETNLSAEERKRVTYKFDGTRYRVGAP